MAGILANSQSHLMESGDESSSVSGYVTRERISLSVVPAATSRVAWTLTPPDDSASATLSNAAAISPSFVPDRAGTWTVTATVDGVTLYSTALVVLDRVGSLVAGSFRFRPVRPEQVLAPSSGLEMFLDSVEDQLRFKRPGGSVADLVVDRSVASLAALVALTGLEDGRVVYVSSLEDAFVFRLGSTITADTITVLADAGATGRWLRLGIASRRWERQASWFIHASSGSDENVGDTSGTALKTWAELERRLSYRSLKQTTTVTLLTNLAEYCRLYAWIDEQAAPNARLIVQSDPTARTTLLTSAAGGLSSVTAITRTAGGGNPLTINDTNTGGLNFASFLNTRIRLTSGANVGALAFVQRAPSATQALTTPFCSPLTAATYVGVGVTEITPATGDQYVLESLPTVYGVDIIVTKASGAASADRCACVFDSIQIGPGSAGTPLSSQNILDAGGASTNASVICALIQSISDAGGITGRQLCVQNHLLKNSAGGGHTLTALLVNGGGATCTVTFSQRNWATQPSIGNDWTLQGGILSIKGPVVVTSNGIGVFNSTGDAVSLAGGSGGQSELYCNGAATVYGNGNTGWGLNLAAACRVRYETTRPTVTGTSGDCNLAGSNYAWTAIPAVDPIKLAGVVQNAATNATSRAIYLTAQGAAISATNIFSATPPKGLYAIEIYLAVTTQGAGGDTASVTLAWTDDAQAESSAVINTVSVAAKGFFTARQLVETTGSANVTYALSFPTKTGSPLVSLRIVARPLESTGS